MAITPNDSVLDVSKHLKGYVPSGRQLGIVCNKFPVGIDRFTEVKVIHSGTILFKQPDVRDDQ